MYIETEACPVTLISCNLEEAMNILETLHYLGFYAEMRPISNGYEILTVGEMSRY